MSPASLRPPPTASHAFSIGVLSSMCKVKHYFTDEVKHCFLPQCNAALHNQRMLDSVKLGAILVKAMAEARPPVTNTALAKACGVTKQAITGWRRNGRIAKKHLTTIAAITGKSLEELLQENDSKGSQAVREKPIPYLVKDTRLEAIIEAWTSFSDEKRQIIYDAAMKHGKRKSTTDFKIESGTKGGTTKVIELSRKAKHRG